MLKKLLLLWLIYKLYSLNFNPFENEGDTNRLNDYIFHRFY